MEISHQVLERPKMEAPKARKLESSTQVHSKSASKLGLYAAYHSLMPKVAYSGKESKPSSVLSGQMKKLPTDAIMAMQAYSVDPSDLTSPKFLGKSQVNLAEAAMHAPRKGDKRIALAYKPWESQKPYY